MVSGVIRLDGRSEASDRGDEPGCSGMREVRKELLEPGVVVIVFE